jgi:hypothetical protein
MAKKAEALRFAVGMATNCQSSVWRLWTYGDDAYFGARDWTNVVKVSLHASGRWRVAFVENLDGPDSVDDRAAFKWNRPPEFVPGWTEGLGLLVPILRPRLPSPRFVVESKDILWIQRPRQGQKLFFKLLISGPELTKDDVPQVTQPGDEIVGGVAKQNGETIWVVAREAGMTPDEVAFVKKVQREMRITYAEREEAESMLNARVIQYNFPDTPDALTQPTIFDIGIGRESVRIQR